MKRILFYVVALGLFAACDIEINELTGKVSDTIGLSAEEVNAGSAASLTEITTVGEHWWITDIKMGEDLFPLREEFEWYYTDELKVEYGDYLPGEITANRIESDWFVITRELQRIWIELETNSTNQQRSFTLMVQDRGFCTDIRVNQAGI